MTTYTPPIWHGQGHYVDYLEELKEQALPPIGALPDEQTRLLKAGQEGMKIIFDRMACIAAEEGVDMVLRRYKNISMKWDRAENLGLADDPNAKPDRKLALDISFQDQWSTADMPELDISDTDFVNVFTKMQALGVGLVRVGTLGKRFAEDSCNSSILRYLEYEGGGSCGAHTDYGWITLHLLGSGPGLQVLHQDTWLDIETPEGGGAFVYPGDCLPFARRSLHALRHRVTGCRGHRSSMVFFFKPDLDTLLEEGLRFRDWNDRKLMVSKALAGAVAA